MKGCSFSEVRKLQKLLMIFLHKVVDYICALNSTIERTEREKKKVNHCRLGEGLEFAGVKMMHSGMIKLLIYRISLAKN